MAIKLRSNRNTATKTSTSDLFQRVQKKAYELYEKRGRTHGKDWSDWFEAERLVKRELR